MRPLDAMDDRRHADVASRNRVVVALLLCVDVLLASLLTLCLSCKQCLCGTVQALSPGMRWHSSVALQANATGAALLAGEEGVMG